VVAAVVVFVATVVWRFLTFTGFTNDHYAHLALAQQFLFGDRPIRDFADPGWPLMYLLSAAAWLLAGNSMAVEWALTTTALALASACTVTAAFRLSGSLTIAVLVAVLEVVIYPRTYSYPKLLPYALSAAAMIALAATPSLRRLLLLSAVIAVAFLLRHDHGLFIGIASAVFVALASGTEGWRMAARRTAILTAGTAMFLLPWILYVAFNGGLIPYFETALEFARRETAATVLPSWPRFQLVQGKPLLGLRPPDRPLAQVQWAPDTPEAVRQTLERRYGLQYVRDSDDARFYHVDDTTAENLKALAGDPHVAGTTGLGRVSQPAWRARLAALSPLRLESGLQGEANAEAWLFWLFWTLPVLCLAIGARRLFGAQERWRGEVAVVLALAVMAMLVDSVFLRKILAERLSDAIVPAALLGAWALGLPWAGHWRQRPVKRLAQAASIILVIVSAIAIGQVSTLGERYAYAGIGGGADGIRRHAVQVTNLLRLSHRQAAPSRYAHALVPFFEYLDRCTSRSDRLIVTGEFPDVVVASGHPFASDGVVFGSWYSSSAHQARTLELLRLRPALFAIHMSGYDRFRERFTLIDEYIRQEYQLMGEVPVEGGDTIRILVHANRRVLVMDSKTGWPCFR
jgi:hypothetical protein